MLTFCKDCVVLKRTTTAPVFEPTNFSTFLLLCPFRKMVIICKTEALNNYYLVHSLKICSGQITTNSEIFSWPVL